jgi:spermidine synthase
MTVETPASNTRRIPTVHQKNLLVASALFFLSGAVGLVYQVVWLRQLTLIFGATAYASSVVLSTFMGGLAFGSLIAARRATGWGPPLRAYGWLELGIAAYASAIPFLLALLPSVLETAWARGAAGHFAAFALLKFVAIAIVILPATTLMGATLPVLSRLACQADSSVRSSVARLYAVNTFGAVTGTITAAFWALPAWGTRRTLAVTIAVNTAVGVLAWLRGRSIPDSEIEAPREQPSQLSSDGVRSIVWAIAISGAAAMVLEVAWTRGLALVLGSSVYAYASMLTAFLIGLASGAGAAVSFLRRRPDISPRQSLAVVLGLVGLLSFGTTYALQSLPRLFAEAYFRAQPSPEGWWLVELGLASFVMFPTTFALGFVFPLVLEVAGVVREKVSASVGRIYAANTLGTIFGAASAGFFLIPALGVNDTLAGVAAVQLALGGWVGFGVRSRARGWLTGACFAGAALVLLLRPEWDVLLMNSGVYMNIQDFDRKKGWSAFVQQVRTDNTLVFARDGLTASVIVANQPEAQNLYLSVNGKVDASSRLDLDTQVLIGHIPLLLHTDPHDVLMVGLASGISAGSAAQHPVDHITVVDVEAAMIDAAHAFSAHNGDVLSDPRVSVSINDARNELQFNPASYDVIISQPSNPWMTVASNLFTEDFFAIAAKRLRPDGVFGQWVQAYCLAPEQLRSIIAGFHKSFPHVLVFETNRGIDLLVIGSKSPLVLDLDALQNRMSELRVRIDLGRVGIRSPLDIAGLLQVGGAALEPLARDAVPNTDDSGYVEFQAPRTLYLETIDANLAMLQATPGDPLNAIRDSIRSGYSEDELRSALIDRWGLRKQFSRVARALDFFSDPSSRAKASEVIRRNN